MYSTIRVDLGTCYSCGETMQILCSSFRFGPVYCPRCGYRHVLAVKVTEHGPQRKAAEINGGEGKTP